MLIKEASSLNRILNARNGGQWPYKNDCLNFSNKLCFKTTFHLLIYNLNLF